MKIPLSPPDISTILNKLEASELADAVLAYNTDLVNYELEFASIDKEEDRLRLEAGLLSKFKINSFGVYNIDKLKNAEILASVNLSFDFENELNPKINRVMLYVIDEKERTVRLEKYSDYEKRLFLGCLIARSNRCLCFERNI